MNTPILTVCIPTYNGKRRMERGFPLLLEMAAAHADLVRVYVSDNCSTDDTKVYVQSYIEKYSHLLSYHCHPTNIGSEENFRSCIRNVTTKYVALIGDDDILAPTYFDVVLDLLKHHDSAALVFVNGVNIEPSGRYSCLRDGLVNYGKPKIYESSAEFIRDHLSDPSLISLNVFDRKLFLESIDLSVGEKYPGYTWLSILFRAIMGQKCIYVDSPLIYVTVSAKCSWAIDSAWYLVYGLGKLFEDLESYVPGVNQAWRLKFRNGKYEEFGYSSIVLNKKLYRQRFPAMRRYLSSRAVVVTYWMYLYLPTVFVKVLLKLYRLIPYAVRRLIGG